MPIISTSNVSKEIRSLLFSNDGSLTVILTKTEDGIVVGEESYRITPEEAAPLLDSSVREGFTIRQQIILAVYSYLLTSGLVAGTITA